MENKRNAEQGTYNGETTYCTVNGWDCPYYKDHEIIEGDEEFCLCKIPGNPYEECDDFFSMFGEGCEPDDYTDYC